MSDDNQPLGDDQPAPDGAVLHMVDFDRGNPARVMSEMREYWLSLRQGRAIPQRADVEPHGIRRALDYAFILERVAPGAARFRLAGRHLIDLMGMEVRGMPLCSFLTPGSRGRLSDVLETVFRAPQLAELTLWSKQDYGRPSLPGKMLLMPLRSDLGDVTRALGCLIAEGDVGATPRRFDLISDRVIPVFEGAETLQPSPSTQAFSEQPAHWKAPLRKSPIPSPKDNVPAQPEDTGPPMLPMTPEERRASFRVVARRD